jgi:hypothetical protein
LIRGRVISVISGIRWGSTIIITLGTKRGSLNRNILGSDLDTLACSGVFVLENPFRKKYYINFSKNILSYLSTIISDIKLGQFEDKELQRDYPQIKVKLLEVRPDIETVPYWQEYYSSKGWESYEAGAKKALPRRAKVVLASLDKSRVEVRLYNRRNDYEVVGVFDNIYRAEEFAAQCYGESNPFCYRVFAANFLTRNELRK